MEVPQGFSLGINSMFYPHVTSRECTVMQGITDARIPPRHVSMTYMCIRTYPIRVGNLGEHSSGGWYPDQQETTWDAIGVPAELTTVTKRVRRVATFSELQFMEAVLANDPDWVAVNFLNYLDKRDLESVMGAIREFRNDYTKPVGLIGGWGPKAGDWHFL